MKTNHFVLKEDGNLYWVKDMPEKPDAKDYTVNCVSAYSYSIATKLYDQAIQSAIDQSVLVQNQDEIKDKIALNEWGIKFGEIYSIECEVVASSQKVENSAHSFTEGSDIFHNKPDLTAKEFLETQGYELLDKDFWMEDYVTDHKFKDLCDLMERYAKQKVQEKTYTREEVRELIYQAFFANSCGRKAGDVHEYFLRWFDENVKP